MKGDPVEVNGAAMGVENVEILFRNGLTRGRRFESLPFYQSDQIDTDLH
jgi:hypothetical protein